MNLLLASLPSEERGRLEAHLERVEVKLSQPLAQPEEAIQYVYFPINAVCSVVHSMQDGSTVETGIIGYEGLVGIQAWLRQKMSAVNMFIQVPGEVLRMKRGVFMKEVVDTDSALNPIIANYVNAFINLTAVTAACNRIHHVDARLCRWLKMMQNRALSNTFPMRQEFLAYMLGVHRPSISIAASALRNAGLIRYERGNLTVLESQGLRDGCCECYDLIETQFEPGAKETFRK